MSEPLPIYNPAEIEPRWQKRWEADGLYHADIDEHRPKFYALTMLPVSYTHLTLPTILLV